ncbi:Ring finger domain-containing protein 8 [Elsinoe fawcettii]|nr:Ring finger domain-containing protein 8 [Elsinoe fawcettii]
MGQSASTQTPQAGAQDSQTRRRTTTIWRRSSAVRPSESLETVHANPRPRTNRPRPASVNRLSQLFPQSSQGHESSAQDHDHSARPSLASRLQRSRQSIFLSPQSLFPRSPSRNASGTPQDLWPSEQRGAATATSAAHSSSHHQRTDITLPDVRLPELDLDFSQTHSTASGPATQRPPSRRSSIRLPSGIADRLGLRSQRQSVASATSNVLSRRRRSPIGPGEDSTALLSRLLSVAAAATAATLLEGSDQSMAEARGTAGDGDDGTFDSFLQSLESGRLAAALRQGTQAHESAAPGSGQPPLNFFRMFRFNPTAASRNSRHQQNSDNRMVPIIIVGIRAVSPGSNVGGSEDTGVPPFLDALSTLPTTPFNANNLASEISDGLRGPQNGTRFSHRRRASMSGLSRFPSGYDNQRHHRSPDRTRPQSVASEIASWPRPPPATPASPNLSTVNSRSNTPAPTVPTSRRSSFSGTPRRESIIRTTTTTTLETTSEDVPAARARPSRPRRASDAERRHSSYASRRHGFVEPEVTAPTDNTRSWIIYVLGGSYPENHPILTTPSLFTDSPTYEDMMLLSTLLGPAKPPVATETDVAAAGGVYQIRVGVNDKSEPILVAYANEGSDRIELAHEERCLVCLCDFEKEEEARKLNECGHLYHRECIDEWLTKGRNSCPLCRGQGVQEKDKKPDPAPVDSARPSPIIPSEPEVSAA